MELGGGKWSSKPRMRPSGTRNTNISQSWKVKSMPPGVSGKLRSSEDGAVLHLGEQQWARTWSLLSQALPMACWYLTLDKARPLSKPQSPSVKWAREDELR